MRKSFLLFLVLQCGLLSAQNWALLNPEYKYNYSNDGTDTIAGQIWVTNVDTLGDDTLVFTLKGRAEFCDTCLNGSGGLGSWCDGCYIWSDVPEFIGGTIISGPNGWYLTNGDTSLIKTHAELGTVWQIASDGTTAEIILSDTAAVLGATDSVKYVSTSGMDTLVLSKDHGVLYYHSGGTSMKLIGVEGLDAGVFKPPFDAFFPYHPGDLLQYCAYRGGIDGATGGYGGSRTFKMTVTGIVSSDSSLDVFVNSICNDAGDFSYLPACGACGTDTFHISAHELPYFNVLWSKPGELMSPSEEACMETNFPVMTKHFLDGNGRYHITSTVKITSGFPDIPAAFLELTSTSTSALYGYRPADFIPEPDSTFGLHYVSGIGLLSFRREVDESWEGYYLQGAVINGDTIGSLTPTGIPEQQKMSPIALHPIPANDHIVLAKQEGLVGTWSITNLTGQQLVSGPLEPSAEQRIDVSRLAAGSYLFTLTSKEGRTTRRVIIAC